MTFRALLASALLSLISPAHAETSAVHPTKVIIHSGGRDRFYYLYIPKSVDPSFPAPVLLLLHGSESHPATFLPMWVADADREGIILASPKSLADFRNTR